MIKKLAMIPFLELCAVNSYVELASKSKDRSPSIGLLPHITESEKYLQPSHPYHKIIISQGEVSFVTQRNIITRPGEVYSLSTN